MVHFFEEWDGVGAYSFVACFRHVTIDHASPSRRGGAGVVSRWSFTASLYLVCGTSLLVLLFDITLNLTGTGVR